MAPITSLFCALAAFLIPAVSAVQPVKVQGSEFINTVTGKRFQMIGVAYQPGGSAGFDEEGGFDPLSDADVCLRDAAVMQKLGVNTLRVYNLNPDLSHDECASIFNAAGIYMILDVNSPLPNQSLNRVAPWESYNSEYLERVFRIVEGFKAFPNLLGFFSGNEIINEDSVVEVPTYIRAVTRDMKDYIAKQADRDIPVGYSAADVRPMLANTAAYLSCAIKDEPSSKIDLFGLNSYSWCGDATFENSGYDVLIADFKESTVPIFFSEYGCNEIRPREFSEVATVYSDKMTDVFSGGLIYEFTQEENDYGLVEFDGNDITLLVEFDTLQKQFNDLDLDKLQSVDAVATSLTPPDCSAKLLNGPAGNFSTNFTLPSRPDGVADLINNGVDKAKIGKLVGVSDTKVKHTVTDSKGDPIDNLSLKKLGDDESNAPSGGTGDGGSSSKGSDQTDTAPRVNSVHMFTLAMAAGVLYAVLELY